MRKRFLTVLIILAVGLSACAQGKAEDVQGREEKINAIQSVIEEQMASMEADNEADTQAGYMEEGKNVNFDVVPIEKYDDREKETDAAAKEECSEPEEQFTFDIYAVPQLYEDVMGEKIMTAYHNMMNAVMQGKREFECDEEFCGWMLYQCVRPLCPILDKYLDYGASGYENGAGHIVLKISDEEFQKEVREFGELVTNTIREAIPENYGEYSEFEKNLALKLYFSERGRFTYDYYLTTDEGRPLVSVIRVLKEKKGICDDFAMTYAYLLTQMGVDAGTIVGDHIDGSAHKWCIVRLNGKCYLMDPTIELNLENSLGMFMLPDRLYTNVYPKKHWVYLNYYTVNYGDKPMDMSAYACNDDSFEPLWNLLVEKFDVKTNTIYCEDHTTYDYTEIETKTYSE